MKRFRWLAFLCVIAVVVDVSLPDLSSLRPQAAATTVTAHSNTNHR